MVRQEKMIKEKTAKNTRASLANKTKQSLNMIEPRKVRDERP